MRETDVTLSVVIPVYNDPAGLKTTVSSLLAQTTNDFELCIADNGSTDDTTRLARRYATRPQIHYVPANEVRSPAAARNAGIRAATGDVIAFLDADMWVGPDWIEKLKTRLEQTSSVYAGCNVVYTNTGNTLIGDYIVSQNEVAFPSYRGDQQYVPTGSLVVSRTIFDEVGLFDERLFSAEDYEFGQRVTRTGYEITYFERVTVYHPARDSFAALLARQHRIGRGKTQYSRLYSEDRSNAQRYVDVFQRQIDIFSQVFNDESFDRQAAFLLIAAFLKAASVAGSVQERVRPTTRPDIAQDGDESAGE